MNPEMQAMMTMISNLTSTVQNVQNTMNANGGGRGGGRRGGRGYPGRGGRNGGRGGQPVRNTAILLVVTQGIIVPTRVSAVGRTALATIVVQTATTHYRVIKTPQPFKIA